MIIHKLIARHLGHRDDSVFYRLQAQDAIGWIEAQGVRLSPGSQVLDLGTGHGIFGAELLQRQCHVTFADDKNWLVPELQNQPFRPINLDRDDLTTLGSFDLVVCSNVLEHLAKPFDFLEKVHQLLKPSGRMYLSWTNWLSPWGGHEFSPFHYLGSKRGHLVYDRIGRRKRIHTPYQNLFPTSIGQVLRYLKKSPTLRIERVAPRYYPELGFILRLPVLREFLTWNCAVLLSRSG